MKTRSVISPFVKWSFFVLATGCIARSAFADNAIALRSVRGPIEVGEIVEIDLSMAFDDPTIGGGFQVEFDSERLEFVEFQFDDDLQDDPRYRCTTETPSCATRRSENRAPIGFGHFDGLAGERPIGRLRLRGLTPGTSPVSLVALSTTGDFVDLTGQKLAIESEGLEITVVPEPGMFAMLASGVLCLSRRARRGDGPIA
jgi:hypothetical protein